MNIRTLTIAALMVTAMTPAVFSQPALSPADIAAIRAASVRYVQASAIKDYPAWSALFTEDAVMMPPDAPAVSGRSEIEKWSRALPSYRDLQVEPLEFEGRADLATVRGRYSFILTLPGQPEQLNSGKYVEVWRRQADGSWKLWRDIFNSDRPAAAPALTRERAYAADMQLVQHALAADNLARARELLQRNKPAAGETDLRGWEWRYLWQLCRPDYSEELRRNVGATWSLALSGDGRWMAVGGAARFSIWDVASRQDVPAPEIAAGRGARAAFAPNRPLLAAVTSDQAPGGERVRYRVVLWDAEAKSILRELPLGGECGGVFFSRDGRTLVTSAFQPGNAITLWNVDDGSVLRRIEAPHRGYGEGTPFAVTNDLSLAAHGAGQRVRVIDLKTGRERWSAEATLPGNAVNTFAFSPDGRLLATAASYDDPSIHLWDADTGELLRRIEGHRRWVPALLFLPDGKSLASASGDLTIRLWDITSG